MPVDPCNVDYQNAVSVGEAAANSTDLETLVEDVRSLNRRLDQKLKKLDDQYRKLEHTYTTAALAIEAEIETVVQLKNGMLRARLVLDRMERRREEPKGAI